MPTDLERVQAYLRRHARHGLAAQALSAFTLYAPAHGDAPDDAMGNAFAIPRRVARPVRATDLEELRAVFELHGARPQVEFLADLFPRLPEFLQAGGYQEAQRKPVLIAHPHEIQSPPAPAQSELVTLSQASSLQDVRENLHTNATGFGEAQNFGEQELWAFRAGLVSGRAFTLRVDARAVAAGMFEAMRGGVTELLGIATLPEYRRRGYAGYLTAAMADSAFAHGATLVYLCAASEEAGRVYERIGFRPCATLVEYFHVTANGANGA
jgi:ribosomal protein S18 acetylase RimI-like enzyme